MTSRRTSRPRTRKQNDPTDNEEALHKAKEDEEIKVKLHRKRGKDALRFNSILGIKERAYFDDDDANATEYLTRLENPEDHYTWVASWIAAGTPVWVKDGGKIYKSDLNFQAKHWLGFVCSRLMPSKNDNEVPLAQEILITLLAMNLCHEAGVLEIERIDENIWANQVVDITKIQDEMNLKLKKRKR
ncbi:hypothetical protein HAX54_015842 [Datura stramonium]|uniref:Uncharacterized protein n=1 Tax=Datura stramonium TaxID=4076 RepID=A0ABS8UKR2_DATST|nr:hypothetical protein [Datura stramonium]